MKNKVSDLNNHLFAQLERLNDEDLKGEALQEEITRSRAIAEISKQIIDSNRVTIAAITTFNKMDNASQDHSKSLFKQLLNTPTE